MNLNTSTVSVSAAGNYTLTVTNPANGCTSTTVVAVIQNTVVPNISSSVPAVLNCTNTSATINGASTTGGVTFNWMPGNINTSSLSVTAAGNYSLTVTDPTNGCTSTTVIPVTQNTVMPNVTATVSGSLTCTTNTVALNGGSSTAGATFTWQPMNVNTSTAVASSSEIILLSVTNPANGCVSTTVVAVIQAAGVPTVAANSSNNINCANSSATLNATSVGNTIVWNGGSLVNAAKSCNCKFSRFIYCNCD